jgi:hypothetical protein
MPKKSQINEYSDQRRIQNLFQGSIATRDHHQEAKREEERYQKHSPEKQGPSFFNNPSELPNGYTYKIIENLHSRKHTPDSLLMSHHRNKDDFLPKSKNVKASH